MTYDVGGEIIDRCPIALSKHPVVSRVLELHRFFESGITPQGLLSKETVFYRWAMAAATSLQNEAGAWYREKTKPRGQR